MKMEMTASIGVHNNCGGESARSVHPRRRVEPKLRSNPMPVPQYSCRRRRCQASSSQNPLGRTRSLQTTALAMFRTYRLTAAGHDPYLLCIFGSCEPDANGNIFYYAVYGTSASAPSFAGIMALGRTRPNPGREIPTASSTALAAGENFGQCNGSDTAVSLAATCVFNDVTDREQRSLRRARIRHQCALLPSRNRLRFGNWSWLG